MKRFAVIPSDPLEEYELKGTGYLQQEYFNPNNFFDEVYALSSLEKEEKEMFGMKIIPTKDKQLKQRLKTLQIDIIRAYDGHKACDMACKFKLNNVPVIVSVHDRRPEKIRKSIKNADIVFSVCDEVTQLVKNYFPYPERIWYLPNRIDFSIMKPIDDDTAFSKLSETYPFKYVILHVGRRSEEKNIETIIKSLEVLGDEFCLLSIGKGNTSSYINLATSLNVEDRCFFLDNIKNNELPLYYSFATCLCNPSITEAMSLALIEALACNCTVITSSVAAKSVNITDNINGLTVFDPLDLNSLIAKIRIACTDKEAVSKIKQNARESVRCFERATVDKTEIGYYQKILHMRNSGCFKKSFFNFWS